MFFDKFKTLCDIKGVSPTRAATEIGLSNATATKWKKTKATPDGSTIYKVCEYFGIGVDYFLGSEADSRIAYLNFLIAKKRREYEDSADKEKRDRIHAEYKEYNNELNELLIGRGSNSTLPVKKAPTDTDGREMGELEFAAHKYEGKLSEADKETIMKLMQTLAAANEAGGDDGKTD